MPIPFRPVRFHEWTALGLGLTGAILFAPVAASAATQLHSHGTWFGYESDDSDRPPTFAYAKVDPSTDSFSGTPNSKGPGTPQAGRRHERDSVLWFRIAGKSYIVRDRATIEHADELMAPERRLDPEVARLDSLEQSLENEQSSLEDDQQQVSERRDEFRGEHVRFEAAEERPNRTARDDHARLRSRLEHEQREIERQSADLERRRASLDERRASLARDQQKLGLEEEKLSHEATLRMRRLVDEALSHHLAERVTD